MDFARTSIEANERVNARAMALISTRMEQEDLTTMNDLVRIADLTNKRMGLYQSERTDTLQITNWTITGGMVTIDMPKPPPAPVVAKAITDIEDAVEVQAKLPAFSFENITAELDAL